MILLRGSICELISHGLVGGITQGHVTERKKQSLFSNRNTSLITAFIKKSFEINTAILKEILNPLTNLFI